MSFPVFCEILKREEDVESYEGYANLSTYKIITVYPCGRFETLGSEMKDNVLFA